MPRICPKCRSTDITSDLSVSAYAQGSIFNKYKCNKCGFKSMFFPEVKIINKKKIKR